MQCNLADMATFLVVRVGNQNLNGWFHYVVWGCMNRFSQMYTVSLFSFLLLVTVFSGNAWAVQGHAAPEGLYVHQLAHVFYAAALCYLFWDIRRSKFKSNGWNLIQIFCVVMVFWNAVAFTGHSVEAFMDSAHLTANTGYWSTRLQGPFTTINILYYITKLDHVVSVSALFFLCLGMRRIYHRSLEEEDV